MLENLSEETTKREELVVVVVNKKGENYGGVVDGKSGVDGIDEVGEVF